MKPTTVLEQQQNGEFTASVETVDLRKKHTKSAALWVPTVELSAWQQNPRDNDKAVPEVVKSIKRFGFASPIIASPDGQIIAGHTRLKAALELRMPEVPVRFMDLEPDEAHLLALADNRVGEIADWNDDLLGDVLRELEGDGVDFKDIGWDVDELAELLGQNDPLIGEEEAYTTKVEAPIYEIKGERPDESELFDQSKTSSLIEAIAAADLPPHIDQFLRAAANRHTAFQYDKIAEYYVHASADVQKLMEDSALVIIDFDRAIELGFVKLSNELAEAYRADHEG